MKKRNLSFAMAGVLAASLFAGCTSKQSAETGADSSQATQASAPSVDRGKYLVTVVGCNDCHTPWKMGANGPEPDMSKMLMGHPAEMKITAPAMLMPPWAWSGDLSMTAFGGPWGVSFAANLTPDSTGLGGWTQDEFIQTLRTGKMKGTGRAILPPMPWEDFKNMTDADLQSIYMYLQSIPKIANRVPDPVPPPAGGPPGMMPPPGMQPGAGPATPGQPGAPPPPHPPVQHHPGLKRGSAK